MAPRPPKVSRRTAVVAGWTTDGPIPREYLTSSDAKVRASALGSFSRNDQLSIADLKCGLADTSPEVRQRALTIMARTWSPEMATEIDLVALLADEDASVLEVACFAAGECLPSTPEVVARLSEICIEHPDPLCRESAVAALGSTGDPGGRDAVLRACEDKATIRRRAVLALTIFESPETDAMLEKMAHDLDWQVRQVAEELLAIE